MATSISGAFTTFKSKLEITDLQAGTVSTRQINVRDAVAAELTVLSSFLSGSYSRSTLIAPLAEADIDVFVVLDPKYYQNDGQAALLDKVKAALRKQYPNTSAISRNGQAVTITFSDFMVDVVPAFNRRGGGYLIPSTYGGGRWIETDPKKHIDISSANNSAHDGKLVPVIKMIKCWNREIGHFFRSFHLEVLAWEAFQDVGIDNYPLALKHFFDDGRSRISRKNPDPVFGGDVGYYITSSNASDAISRFATAYNRATKAIDYAENGKTEDAINEWRKIFGTRFPAFG